MKPDIYTKCVLTVIAAALCALVAQNAITNSKAKNIDLQKVQICDDYKCLLLNPIRQRGSTGDGFLEMTLPISIERESQ